MAAEFVEQRRTALERYGPRPARDLASVPPLPCRGRANSAGARYLVAVTDALAKAVAERQAAPGLPKTAEEAAVQLLYGWLAADWLLDDDDAEGTQDGWVSARRPPPLHAALTLLRAPRPVDVSDGRPERRAGHDAIRRAARRRRGAGRRRGLLDPLSN